MCAAEPVIAIYDGRLNRFTFSYVLDKVFLVDMDIIALACLIFIERRLVVRLDGDEVVEGHLVMSGSVLINNLERGRFV